MDILSSKSSSYLSSRSWNVILSIKYPNLLRRRNIRKRMTDFVPRRFVPLVDFSYLGRFVPWNFHHILGLCVICLQNERLQVVQHYTRQHGHLTCCQLSLDKGTVPLVTDYQDYTPLQYAGTFFYINCSTATTSTFSFRPKTSK